ncbi:transmembrane protein 225 isoform X3 [Zalophus californianus]|uniref:Transmembrane protein 225 isoform X3 n=1 Tax=Zalophus californianus TaxID=9704 RepID=A0A6J2BXB8_ZALCA|nr:transmembrane protein 225 isoform X3 [Zalophus californianus]
MVNVSLRSIQALNMFFSSWALVFMVIGILIEEWVELTLETKKNTISHNPWICCTPLWPEDGLEVVRIMMILVLSLSFFHNLFLGLEFTYLVPQTKHIFFITVFLSFFTGILSFLECKQSTKVCPCMTLIRIPERERQDTEESENSFKVVSSPDAAMLRSIVHSREDSPNRQLQTRRVTWAL